MRSVPNPARRFPARPANEGQGSSAARLEAMRRESGALTHDFNNLLGVILSANERLVQELPEGGEAQRLARLALEAAERGAVLVRRTLAIGQERHPAPETTDCAMALDTVRRLARQGVPPEVRLKVLGSARPARCAADRTGLEMALLNLCLNAGHATPAGGTISIVAHSHRLAGLDAHRLGLAPGGYLAFTVRDTGAGLAPEVLARATNPLFTTKPAGTGLGMSSVVDFAKGAGGALSLWSREGQGTTATLYLPAAPRRRRRRRSLGPQSRAAARARISR